MDLLSVRKFIKSSTTVAVLTKDGFKLIGVIIPEEMAVNLFGLNAEFFYSLQEGICLKRKYKKNPGKTDYSFLALNNIKSIRPAKPGEKDIDHVETF